MLQGGGKSHKNIFLMWKSRKKEKYKKKYKNLVILKLLYFQIIYL